MKTQYLTATSVDGFITDEHNSLDWLFQFGGPGDELNAFMNAVGAVAMGSHTYDWVLDNEILKDPNDPKPWPYHQPAWIFTTRKLRKLENANITFTSDDVEKVHRDMVAAANGKNVWLIGGGDLVGQFYEKRLLDEIHLAMAPVTLGAGAPLLPRRIATPPMKLQSCDSDPKSGFVKLVYEVVY